MKGIFTSIVRKNRKKIVFMTLISLFITIIGVVLPYLNGRFIDYLTIGVEYRIILKMCVLILGLGLLNVIFYYINQILNAKIRLRASFDLKLKIIEHLRKISIIQYKKYDPSYLNHRTEQDINDIVTFIITNYATFFINIVQIALLICIIFVISNGIALLMLIFLPIYYLVYSQIKKPLYSRGYAAKEAQNFYYNILNEQFTFMEDIKIGGNYNFNNNYINKYYIEYEKNYMHYVRISGKFSSLDGIISAIFQVVTFLYGGWQTLNGKMSVGELTVICTYFSMALQLIKYYFELGKSYQNVKTSLNRLKEILAIEIENEGNQSVNTIFKIKGMISYEYEKGNKVLNDFEIELERGKIYGIVGANGSGKSTLSKLLIGLLRGEKIKINGISISDIKMKDLRLNNILYIPQNINYPNRTIQEIYQECHDGIEADEIIQKIRKLQLSEAEEIVMLIKSNWNNNINELSGGEKQIISALKCLVKEFDFVIFDEPTSNLDTGRSAILIGLLKYLKDSEKIVLIITHDPVLKSSCDKVFYLDKEEKEDVNE